MTRPRIDSLTGIRGLLALGIVVYHSALAFAPNGEAVRLTRQLPVVVSFFFVLSGFVLTWSWDDRSTGHFYRDRAARLLPLYLVCWLIAVTCLAWLGWAPTTSQMLSSVLLVQSWVPGPDYALKVNAPAWSLSCEAAFYLVAPWLIPRLLAARTQTRSRVAWVVGCLWIVAAVWCVYLPWSWWPPLRFPEFVAGILLASAMRSGFRASGTHRVAAWLSMATLVAQSITTAAIPISLVTLASAPASFAIILLATTAELEGRPWLTGQSLMRKLGAWSYALYLSHWCVVVVLSRFLQGAQWILLGVLVSLVAAAVLHIGVERAFYRPVRRTRDLEVPTREGGTEPMRVQA